MTKVSKNYAEEIIFKPTKEVKLADLEARLAAARRK